MAAIHILLPQVEHVLRRMLAALGIPTNRRNRYGGFQEKTLNDILRERAMQDVLGESIALYLQVLLCDPIGWNVRNRVAHGLMRPEDVGRTVADRLFHVLAVLGQFRAEPAEEQTEIDGNQTNVPRDGSQDEEEKGA